MLLTWLLARSRLVRTQKQLKIKLESASSQLREMLAEQIKEDTEHTFSRFLDILTPAGEEAALREAQLLQQTQTVAHLRESFDRLERELQVSIPTA